LPGFNATACPLVSWATLEQLTPYPRLSTVPAPLETVGRVNMAVSEPPVETVKAAAPGHPNWAMPPDGLAVMIGCEKVAVQLVVVAAGLVDAVQVGKLIGVKA